MTKEKLIITNNSLKDIINWLKQGHIVCLYTNHLSKLFYKNATIDFIQKEYLIYINLNKTPELISEDEWPWYILNEGFSRYISSYHLPSNANQIYHFSL
jgi:hypothetical protein